MSKERVTSFCFTLIAALFYLAGFGGIIFTWLGASRRAAAKFGEGFDPKSAMGATANALERIELQTTIQTCILCVGVAVISQVAAHVLSRTRPPSAR